MLPVPVWSESVTERLPVERPWIGGSDLAAVCGLSPYEAPIDVWLQKTGRAPPKETNLAMRIGILAEPMLGILYEEATGETTRAPAECIHPKYPFIKGHPDREIWHKRKSCELKTGNIFTAHAWGEPGTDEVPMHYLVQELLYMSLRNDDEGAMAVLLGGNDFRVYRLHRDQALEERLIEMAVRFWTDHVLADVPPPPDGSEGMSEYLTRRYPKSVGDLIPSTPEIEALAATMREAKQAREGWENIEALAKQKLTVLVGDARGVKTEAGSFTYTPRKGDLRTDWKAVAAEVDPKIIERHTSIGNPYRFPVFRPTKEK